MTSNTPNPSEYVRQAALLIDLPLAPEHRPGVEANLERIQTVAQLVLEFPLPDDLVAAPVFEP